MRFKKFNENNKFELSNEIKEIIDLEKKYHSNAFSETSDELERDIEYDKFLKDVFDQIVDLLPDNYNYYDVLTAIEEYIY